MNGACVARIYAQPRERRGEICGELAHTTIGDSPLCFAHAEAERAGLASLRQLLAGERDPNPADRRTEDCHAP